jgi:hypothetical protein
MSKFARATAGRLLPLALATTLFAAEAQAAGYAITSLNMPLASLLTIGDSVEIRIVAPSDALARRAVVTLNGLNVTSALRPAGTPGSLTGTVQDLRPGDNVLQLFAFKAAKKAQAQIHVTRALAPVVACEGVTAPLAVPIANVVVKTAVLRTATSTLPEHCQVDGVINERIGIDGQTYGINFRVRMPSAWNERFYMGGGGGTNGSLVDPMAVLPQGFVTIGTDSGHNNSVDNDPSAGGAASFGVDPQARIDFGYSSYDQVTQVGKAIVSGYYGLAPLFSYYQGCSEGGREGLLMSQRFPQHYDGIIAGDPVLHLPKGPMNGAWTTQIFAGLATRSGLFLANGEPAVNKTYSDPDLLLVRNAILGVCDALDGLADGIVDNLPACTPARVHRALGALQCSGGKSESCLSADQIASLRLAFDGPTGIGLVNSAGEQLYPNWPWDAGIGGQSGTSFNGNWRSWWLGSYNSATNNATKLVFATALGVAYRQPPLLPFPQGYALTYALGYDFDTDYQLLMEPSGIYTKGAKELWFADDPNLARFRDRGGKLMIYHGAADSSVSMYDTLHWYEAVDAFVGGTARGFARFFSVPGMNHCSGGPSTDRFNMLPQLIDWVENGVAPKRVDAAASNPGYFGVESRTRPLCPYPEQARYQGSGDINVASSFVCRRVVASRK